MASLGFTISIPHRSLHQLAVWRSYSVLHSTVYLIWKFILLRSECCLLWFVFLFFEAVLYQEKGMKINRCPCSWPAKEAAAKSNHRSLLVGRCFGSYLIFVDESAYRISYIWLYFVFRLVDFVLIIHICSCLVMNDWEGEMSEMA